jgi:hypothetical protein
MPFLFLGFLAKLTDVGVLKRGDAKKADMNLVQQNRAGRSYISQICSGLHILVTGKVPLSCFRAGPSLSKFRRFANPDSF